MTGVGVAFQWGALRYSDWGGVSQLLLPDDPLWSQPISAKHGRVGPYMYFCALHPQRSDLRLLLHPWPSVWIYYWLGCPGPCRRALYPQRGDWQQTSIFHISAPYLSAVHPQQSDFMWPVRPCQPLVAYPANRRNSMLHHFTPSPLQSQMPNRSYR